MNRFCINCGSVLEEVLQKDISRMYCPACKRFQYRNPMAAVAGIVLNKRGAVLLGKRGFGQKYEGMWCIPCGHIEWGEEIRIALRREMKEETGLEVDVLRIYNVYSNFHKSDALSVGCWFLCHSVGGNLCAGSDISEVKYFDYASIPELAFQTDRYILDELWKDKLLR